MNEEDGPRGPTGYRGDTGVRGAQGPVGGAGGPGLVGLLGLPGMPGHAGRVHVLPGPRGDGGNIGTTHSCNCSQVRFQDLFPTLGAIAVVPTVYVVEGEQQMHSVSSENVMVVRRDTHRLLLFSRGHWVPVSPRAGPLTQHP
ncbi:acetylcholinesterase collagenic tail peptide-like [Gadus macrocephalus]|uniref:acetylcholinesterase collagenic tail peptide-like n=1 Tax=Gadus macrocephalus TaxID=80720 RepID=UPI0028CB4C5E|nr:acetylcholinesterase collagenic tail peptide-like [Gadus macrocephalus]